MSAFATKGRSKSEDIRVLVDFADEVNIPFPPQLMTTAEFDDTFGIFEPKQRLLSAPTLGRSSTSTTPSSGSDCFSPILIDERVLRTRVETSSTSINMSELKSSFTTATTKINTNSFKVPTRTSTKFSEKLQATTPANDNSSIYSNSINNCNGQNNNTTSIDSSLEKSRISHHRILAGSASMLGLNDGFMVDSSSTSITSGEQTSASYNLGGITLDSNYHKTSSTNKLSSTSNSNISTPVAVFELTQGENSGDKTNDSVFISPITIMDESPSRGCVGSLSDESGILEVENFSTFYSSSPGSTDRKSSNNNNNNAGKQMSGKEVSEADYSFVEVFEDAKAKRKQVDEEIVKMVQEMFDAASPSKNPHLYTTSRVSTHNFSSPYVASSFTTNHNHYHHASPRTSIGPSRNLTDDITTSTTTTTVMYGTPSRRDLNLTTPRQFTPIRREYSDDGTCFPTPATQSQQRFHSSSSTPSCHEEEQHVAETSVHLNESIIDGKMTPGRPTPTKFSLNDPTSRLPTPTRLSFSSTSSSSSGGEGPSNKKLHMKPFPGKTLASTGPHVKIQSAGYKKGVNMPKLKLAESSKVMSKTQPLKAMHQIKSSTVKTKSKATVELEDQSPVKKFGACVSAPVHRKFLPPIAASSPIKANVSISGAYELGTPPRNKRMSNVRSSGYGQQHTVATDEANTSRNKANTSMKGASPARGSVAGPMAQRRTSFSNIDLPESSIKIEVSKKTDVTKSCKENNPKIQQKFGFRR